ncbi:GNAT family N-acetyltransferase [Bacillus swezeyi]|uniref:GNAT family N-acetyltransferase n=1 Tax=Bacillus swezeyi TaxID=1925020 RepID=UPI0039C61366
MKTETEFVHLIEKLAVNAWPSYIQQVVGQWKVRATFGVTKRANSVHAIGSIPKNQNWLQIIEQFYKEKSISPCFYISEISPMELDRLLEAKGYKKLDEFLVMTASCSSILKNVDLENRFTINSTSEVVDKWIDDFISLEGFPPQRYQAYSYIFSAIKFKKNFVSIYEEGKIVGLGTVVVEQGWGCISNIVVDQNHRRKGIAAQLIRHLSEWAYVNKAHHIYLQVLKENKPAIGLYNKLGFIPISKNHYRMLTNE